MTNVRKDWPNKNPAVFNNYGTINAALEYMLKAC
jgi:hypothetical protein